MARNIRRNATTQMRHRHEIIHRECCVAAGKQAQMTKKYHGDG